MAKELSYSDRDALPPGLYQNCPPSLGWKRVMQRVMTMEVPDDKQLWKRQVPELAGYIHKHPRIYHSDLVGRWIAHPFL